MTTEKKYPALTPTEQAEIDRIEATYGPLVYPTAEPDEPIEETIKNCVESTSGTMWMTRIISEP